MAEKMKYQSYDWKTRFSDTAELLPNIICEVDTKGYLTWVNRIGLECFKYTAEQFEEGVHLSRIIHPDDLDEGMANVKALLEGKRVEPMEYLPNVPGTLVWGGLWTEWTKWTEWTVD